MKKNTIILVSVGVVLLLAIPLVVLATRRKTKKSSVVAGDPEKQTKEQFEADRREAEKKISLGPLGGLGKLIESMPTYVVSTRGSDLNIRKEPNANAEIIGKLKNGTRVKGNPPKDGWVQLARADRAFVSANFLKKVADGTAALK